MATILCICITQRVRNAHDPEFADFVDSIGDGAGPIITLDMIDVVISADDLMNYVYPVSTLQNPIACLSRANLAPTNIQVDQYNDTILQYVEGTPRQYLASDSLKEAEDAATLRIYSLKKTISPRTGLCNYF